MGAVGSVGAATTTITGTTGGNNSWNEPTNWNNGVPTGSDDAIIGDGILAIVDSLSTTSYSGTLTVGEGSTLRVRNNPASDSLVPFNAIGTGGIIMKANATIDSATRADPVYPSVTLDGNGRFLSSDSDADRDNRFFTGQISGSGQLEVTGRNVEVWTFNSTTSNTFTGGTLLSAVDRYVVRANTTGAFGTGDVTITPRANADLRSAVIYFSANQVMSTSATLNLAGRGGASTTGFTTEFNSNNGLIFLSSGTTNTIAAANFEGNPIDPGTYSGGDFTWLLGTGTLVIVPEPSTALLGGLGVLALLRRRR